MRSSRLFAVLAAFAAISSAQNLTGRWEARMSQADEARKMVLALTQNGNSLTGYMMQPNTPSLPIVEATIAGNQITIVIERPGRAGGPPPAPAAAPGVVGAPRPG